MVHIITVAMSFGENTTLPEQRRAKSSAPQNSEDVVHGAVTTAFLSFGFPALPGQTWKSVGPALAAS